MVVYIEYAIIDNLIIDYFLLKATLTTTGKSLKKVRLFLCAILGTGVALVYPLLYRHRWILNIVKLLTGVTLILLASEYKGVKDYLINLCVFLGYTFITGGALLAIADCVNSSEMVVGVVFLPAYLILSGFIKLVKYIYKSRHVLSFTYKIRLQIGDIVVNCTGFLDTGNGAYYLDSPVIVCDKKFFVKNFLKAGFCKKLIKIPVQTVGGKSYNFATPIESLVIYIGKEQNIYNNVVLMVAKQVGLGYDLILHPQLFKECGYENKREFEKVS